MVSTWNDLIADIPSTYQLCIEFGPTSTRIWRHRARTRFDLTNKRCEELVGALQDTDCLSVVALVFRRGLTQHQCSMSNLVDLCDAMFSIPESSLYMEADSPTDPTLCELLSKMSVFPEIMWFTKLLFTSSKEIHDFSKALGRMQIRRPQDVNLFQFDNLRLELDSKCDTTSSATGLLDSLVDVLDDKVQRYDFSFDETVPQSMLLSTDHFRKYLAKQLYRRLHLEHFGLTDAHVNVLVDAATQTRGWAGMYLRHNPAITNAGLLQLFRFCYQQGFREWIHVDDARYQTALRLTAQCHQRGLIESTMAFFESTQAWENWMLSAQLPRYRMPLSEAHADDVVFRAIQYNAGYLFAAK